MSALTAGRVWHEYTQTNDAQPEKVFPLLCPVREADSGVPAPDRRHLAIKVPTTNQNAWIALCSETMR
jgi:hypothetical protein